MNYNNMKIQNNRITFKNFDFFEMKSNYDLFGIKLSEIEFNLIEPEYECVLYVNRHVEIARFIIDDIYIYKNIEIKNNVNNIFLIETISTLFNYNGKRFEFIIKTEVNGNKHNFQKEMDINEYISPLSILNNNPIIETLKDVGEVYVDPLANANSTGIDEFDSETFVGDNEKVNTHSKVVMRNHIIDSDNGLNEEEDDLM